MFCLLFCDMWPDLERPGVRGDLREQGVSWAITGFLLPFNFFTIYFFLSYTLHHLCFVRHIHRNREPLPWRTSGFLYFLGFSVENSGALCLSIATMVSASPMLPLSFCFQNVLAATLYFCQLSAKGPLTSYTMHLLIMPCNTMQRHTIPHNTIPYNNIQYHSKYTLPFLRIYLHM